jgi:hypothetical protein
MFLNFCGIASPKGAVIKAEMEREFQLFRQAAFIFETQKPASRLRAAALQRAGTRRRGVKIENQN